MDFSIPRFAALVAIVLMLGQRAPAAERFFETLVSEAGQKADRLPATCGHGSCKSKCRSVCCEHCPNVYGDYLFIQASGVDMTYGIPQDGLGGPGTVPVGGAAIAEPQYESGFRVGFNHALDDRTSLGAGYTWFNSSTADQIATAGANVINPLVVFPGIHNVGNLAQLALANYDIDFQLADIDYRVRRWAADSWAVNTLVGLRYANMDQDFRAEYRFAPPDGTTVDTTTIDFDGYGLRFGLEAERHLHECSPIRVYAKGYASVLTGHFGASYLQDNQFNGREVTVAWTDERFVPIVETELGLAWKSPCHNWQISAGYYMSAWFNAVTTPVWVQAVQNTNFASVEDTVTFDGLVARLEFLW